VGETGQALGATGKRGGFRGENERFSRKKPHYLTKNGPKLAVYSY